MTRPVQSALNALGISAAGGQAEEVDLRQIPRDRWNEYEGLPLLLPEAVKNYLERMEDKPSVLEIDHLCDAVESFHGITTPFTASYLANGKICLIRE